MNWLKRILLGLAIAALVAGCAGGRGHHTMGGDHPVMMTKVCPPTACDVYVMVWTEADGTCRLQVSDWSIEVPRSKSPVLTWQLRPLNPSDGYDYRFNSTTGIEFKPTSPITSRDFDGNHAIGHDKYSWRAVNGYPPPQREFFYNVNVQRKPGTGPWADCPVLDPRIVNDGS